MAAAVAALAFGMALILLLAANEPAARPPDLRIASTLTDTFAFGASGDFERTGNPDTLALAMRAKASGASFLLALGDLGYAPDEDAWCGFMKGAFDDVAVIAGNHDVQESPGGNISKYVAYCPFPLGVSVTGGSGTPGYGYEYFFDYPAQAPLARFVLISAGLEGDLAYDFSATSVHYAFVVDAVQDARDRGIPWVIVGLHKTCLGISEENYCGMGKAIFNELVNLKVDLILQGHDHAYERTKQIALGPGCTSVRSDGDINLACIAADGAGGTYVKGVGSVVVVQGIGGREADNVTLDGSDLELGYFVEAMGNNTNTQGLDSGFGYVRYEVRADRITGVTDLCPPGSTDATGQCSDRVSGTFRDQFAILNPNPVARFTASREWARVHEDVGFDASGSYTPEPLPLEARWDWEDDGTWDTAFSSSLSATHAFAEAGLYTVRVEVRTASGLAATATVRVGIDGEAPATTSTLTGVSGNDGWFTSEVVVELTATDDLSGFVGTSYRIDSGDWQPYAGPFPVSGDSIHSLLYFSQDRAGNLESVHAVDVKIDGTPPRLQLPGDLVVEATGPLGAIVTFDASAEDGLIGPVPVACERPSGSLFPLGTSGVACSATDDAGNLAEGSFLVLVVDATPPELAVPGSVLAEATDASGAVVDFDATAADLVDGSVAVTCIPSSGSRFPFGTTVVVCSASDAAGNVGSASFSVLVQDTTPPAFGPLADIEVEATGASGASVTFTITATDLVDGLIAATCVPSSGSVFPLGTTTVTCGATDAHGNVATASFTVTVHDTTAPSLEVPAGIVTEATGPAGASVVFTATATDLVDGSIDVTCSPESGAIFPVGITIVTCTASDSSGNTATASFVVEVVDSAAPIVHVPGDVLVEATGPSGALVSFDVSATDLVDGSLPVTCNPSSGSVFPLGGTTVTCSATDSEGNVGAASFRVTVVDTTAPTISVPPPIIAEATAASGAAVFYAVDADDLVDGSVLATCTPAPGATFPIGTTTVTCAATDAHGNTATASFTITVRDTTPPSIQAPSAIVTEATGPSGAIVTFTVTATDLVDGAIAATCTPSSGSVFPIGSTTATCAAEDAHGNVATVSFTVSVRDTTSPSLQVPSRIVTQASGPSGAIVTFTVTATDLVDGSIDAACSPPSGSTFPIGITTVTCTAQDRSGNTARASFEIEVVDSGIPLVRVPGNLLVEAAGPSGALVTFEASATDAVDGSLPVLCTPSSGSVFPLGETVVTCTATDSSGNVGSASFLVTVVDSTPPQITVPGPVVAEATGPAGAAVSFTADAVDLVDGPVTPTCVPSSGATFPVGATTVTCSAVDSHGNTATASFTVTVRDTTPPTLQVPATVAVEATGPQGAVVTFTAGATDIVDGNVAVACDPASGSVFPLGETVVTCTATDSSGNVGSASFLVVVRDTTPPILRVPPDMAVEATGPGGAVIIYTSSAEDLVDGPIVASCRPASGSTFPLGTTAVQCTATDARGNSATAFFDVTVRDTTAPTVVAPADQVVEATSSAGAIVTYPDAQASDLVGVVGSPTCSPASGSTFPFGATTVTCTAHDTVGNVGSASFLITVQDTTPPEIHVPASFAAEATGPAGAVVTYDASATDLVDGSLAVSCAPVSGASFPLGTTTVACTAVDARGNTGTDEFLVTVRDTTAPVTIAPPDRTVTAVGSLTPVDLGTPTVSDLVDPAPVVTNDAPAGGFPVGTTLVTWTATDFSGNRASVVQRVTVLPAGPVNTPGKITAGGASVDRNTNFGFVVSSCDGVTFGGQFEYQDRARGINLHAGMITSLTVSSDGRTGSFGGVGTVDGMGTYRFRVDVADRGEPGSTDEFRITIDGLEYSKGGFLVRGNVQIHKQPCALRGALFGILDLPDPAWTDGIPLVIALGLLGTSIRSRWRNGRDRAAVVVAPVADLLPFDGLEEDRRHAHVHREMARIATEARAALRALDGRGIDGRRLEEREANLRGLLRTHRCHEALQELRELYALALGYLVLEDFESRDSGR